MATPDLNLLVTLNVLLAEGSVARAARRLRLSPSGRHILVSRRGLDTGPIDAVLKPLGLERQIATIVSGFATALALARASDLDCQRSRAAHRRSPRRYA